MADYLLHAHPLGYRGIEDAGTAFADEIDRVARQFVVLHFEQQQRVRLAGRVEAFRGFQRVAEFEWACVAGTITKSDTSQATSTTLPAGGSR